MKRDACLTSGIQEKYQSQDHAFLQPFQRFRRKTRISDTPLDTREEVSGNLPGTHPRPFISYNARVRIDKSAVWEPLYRFAGPLNHLPMFIEKGEKGNV